MKTRDFAETLIAFSGLVETGRADDLRKLAEAFGAGKEEPIAARLKKMSAAPSHPLVLKSSLEAISTGFRAAGASKQANAIEAVLKVFHGPAGATVESFIGQITTPPPRPASKKKVSPPPAEPDLTLARQLADELTRTLLDTASFGGIVKQLKNPKQVNTPTLAVVANRFLGNSKPYSGRKDAIDDIVKRQKADAREHARGQALNRLGV